MSLHYTVRPISDRTAFTGKHASSPFQAAWSSTLDLLEHEIWMLNGRHVVIEADVSEQDIRIDGLLRASARPATPGVRIAFESKYGPLVYATDRFTFWQHNVRAIALGLEALRKVDRYGITKRDEQYTGWKALPAGEGGLASALTVDEAFDVIAKWSNAEENPDVVRLYPREQIRLAKANAHPDRNDGERGPWDHVEQAVAVLRRAGVAS